MRDELSPARSEELARLLGPARRALDHLPREVREPIVLALESVSPVLRLWDAEAAASEQAAATARRASGSERTRSQRVADAVQEVEQREAQRWTRVEREVETLLADDAAPDPTALAELLEIAGAARDPDEFDAFMR